MTPLYYFPGRNRPPALADLSACGLDRTWYGLGKLDDPPAPGPGYCHNDHGPDNGSGLVCELAPCEGGQANNVQRPIGELKWTPVWIPSEPGPVYWLGLDPLAPPTPEDLARAELVEGYALKLADGNRWIVPVAAPLALPQFHNALPKVLGMSASGELLRTIRPSFADVQARADQIFEWIYNDAPAPPLVDQFLWASDVLALNYRVDRYLISALGLLEESMPERVLALHVDSAAIYRERIAQAEQKKTAEAPATPPAG